MHDLTHACTHAHRHMARVRLVRVAVAVCVVLMVVVLLKSMHTMHALDSARADMHVRATPPFEADMDPQPPTPQPPPPPTALVCSAFCDSFSTI